MSEESANTPQAGPPEEKKRRSAAELLQAAKEALGDIEIRAVKARKEVRKRERNLELEEHDKALASVEDFFKSLPKDSPFTLQVVITMAEKARTSGKSVQSVFEFLDGKRSSSSRKPITSGAKTLVNDTKDDGSGNSDEEGGGGSS